MTNMCISLGEYSGDYNELLYLRARHYAPSTGRFLTKDTWMGNYNIPLSLNRWVYVGGNPVNLTDPSGRFPPIWCQMMPNKATYELCVDHHYDIEPISYFTLGEYVEGEQGCYSGPTRYRAPGYIEGFGLTVTPSVVNWLFAVESVYDFATMEQQYFINDYVPGLGLSDSIWGGAVSQYAGVVYGLRSDSSINFTYSGPVLQSYKAISGDLGLGISAGRTTFRSPIDLMVHGETWHLAVSLGVDVLPVADLGAGILSLAPFNPSRPPKSYLEAGNANEVKVQELYMNIVLG